jgi:hypothetical protein
MREGQTSCIAESGGIPGVALPSLTVRRNYNR